MISQTVFVYGEKEVEYLASRDAKLGAAMKEIGHIERPTQPDLFVALVDSIVGQQISSKAQATVWGRMVERFEPMTPERIAAATQEELQSVGISFKKAGYIKEIALSVLDGRIDLAGLHAMNDEEVSSHLVQIKGIGVWTAEMLMIFSLQRPDIFSKDDLAIIRGLRMIYHHRKITPALFTKYKRRYSPYASVASLYLWAISSGACPHLKDHAPMTQAQKTAKAKKRKAGQ